MDRFSCFSIPELDGLVGAAGGEALRIPRPGYSEYASLVLAVPDFCLGFSGLAIVEEYLAICAHTDQRIAVRTECQAVDIPLVPLQTRIEFERCAVVEDRTGIISCSRGPERPLLPYAHAIDLRRMPTDGAHCVPGIRGNAMSKFFFPISYCDQSLAVAVPCQIIDAARDDRVLSFRSA